MRDESFKVRNHHYGNCGRNRCRCSAVPVYRTGSTGREMPLPSLRTSGHSLQPGPSTRAQSGHSDRNTSLGCRDGILMYHLDSIPCSSTPFPLSGQAPERAIINAGKGNPSGQQAIKAEYNIKKKAISGAAVLGTAPLTTALPSPPRCVHPTLPRCHPAWRGTEHPGTTGTAG